MNTFSKVKLVLQGVFFLANFAGSVSPDDFQQISLLDKKDMKPDEFKLLLPHHYNKWNMAPQEQRIMMLHEGLKEFNAKQNGSRGAFIEQRIAGTDAIGAIAPSSRQRIGQNLSPQALQNLTPDAQKLLKQTNVQAPEASRRASSTRSSQGQARSSRSSSPMPGSARRTPNSERYTPGTAATSSVFPGGDDTASIYAPSSPNSRNDVLVLDPKDTTPAAMCDANEVASWRTESTASHPDIVVPSTNYYHQSDSEAQVAKERQELREMQKDVATTHQKIRANKRSYLLKKMLTDFMKEFPMSMDEFRHLKLAVFKFAGKRPGYFNADAFLRGGLYLLSEKTFKNDWTESRQQAAIAFLIRKQQREFTMLRYEADLAKHCVV